MNGNEPEKVSNALQVALSTRGAWHLSAHIVGLSDFDAVEREPLFV